MDTNVEKDCSVLEELFQQVVNDMKVSIPVWEDFTIKTSRLHSALKTTILFLTSFLESFQKVADMATGTRGSTREIGSALTRLCLRHRSIENKLKGFTNAIPDALIVPLQERLEEWKKTVVVLDRDHCKENKRAHQEIKRSSLEVVRQQKKMKKGKMETSDQLDCAVQDVNDKLLMLKEFEKSCVKSSLIEERSRLCLFVSCLKPVMDEEIAMLTEVTHLQEVVQSLCLLADDPDSLSSSSEQVISDLIGARTQNAATPGSPSSKGSLTSSGGSMSRSPTQLYSRSQSQPNPSVGLSYLPMKDAMISNQDISHSSTAVIGDQATNTGRDVCKGSSSSAAETGVTSTSSNTRHQREGGGGGGGEMMMMMRTKDSTYSGAAFDRPHTISTSYERSSSRPIITSETYIAPQLYRHHHYQQQHHPHHQQQQQHQFRHHRPQSTSGASGIVVIDDNPYAVPCVVPKRRPTQTGDVKVADIYARPSLVSGTGYRTPNIRPLPVATPTVPDFGGAAEQQQQPAFPVAGYVNMNQLAHMAIQHQQQELKQKKEQPIQHQQQELKQKTEQPESSSDEKTDDDEMNSLKYSKSVSSANEYKTTLALQRYGSLDCDTEHDVATSVTSYGTWSSSGMSKEPVSDVTSTTMSGSGIDLHALADRLERACRLDRYCTLPHPRSQMTSRHTLSAAGVSVLYSGVSSAKDVTSKNKSPSTGRGGGCSSVSDLPISSTSSRSCPLPRDDVYGRERRTTCVGGADSRPVSYTTMQPTDEWIPSLDSSPLSVTK